MNVDKKILAAVKKSFAKFDFSRLEEICKNEAQTRMYLIEPMCEMLGYSRSDAKSSPSIPAVFFVASLALIATSSIKAAMSSKIAKKPDAMLVIN